MYKYVLAVIVIFQLPAYAQTKAFINNTLVESTDSKDSVASKNTVSTANTKDSDNISIPKQSVSQKRAFDRQAATFKVYPSPASNVVYMHIFGEQMVTLHNANDSLIFKVRIREKATINIRKLPVGAYYFTDIKTGLRQPMVIAR